jgi:hypothetical protein
VELLRDTNRGAPSAEASIVALCIGVLTFAADRSRRYVWLGPAAGLWYPVAPSVRLPRHWCMSTFLASRGVLIAGSNEYRRSSPSVEGDFRRCHMILRAPSRVSVGRAEMIGEKASRHADQMLQHARESPCCGAAAAG